MFRLLYFFLYLSLQPKVQEGIRVLVPFGRTKTYLAIVARMHDEQPQGYAVKEIMTVVDETPILLPQQLKLWQWLSYYYMSPIGMVMKAALPSGMKNEEEKKKKPRLPLGGEPHPESIKQLNAIQQEAFNQIQFQFLKKKVVLLHGVTGSGKTEIYIHLIQQALDRHEQVLYLLPEIALTVQMMDRLRRVFGNRLGIYHSKYSDAERVEIWQKQLSQNPYDVILGVRSSVFLPFQRLGFVIVDEEHETSFKQQDPMPRYHARDVAVMLAQLAVSTHSSLLTPHPPKILLGTATPSMESYYNAKTGKYGLVELTERYKGIELPEIRIVDVKALQHRKEMHGPFSPLLLASWLCPHD